MNAPSQNVVIIDGKKWPPSVPAHFVIPFALSPAFTESGRRVGLVCAARARFNDGQGFERGDVWLSRTQLADLANVARRSVYTALLELQHYGVVVDSGRRWRGSAILNVRPAIVTTRTWVDPRRSKLHASGINSAQGAIDPIAVGSIVHSECAELFPPSEINCSHYQRIGESNNDPPPSPLTKC